LAVEPNIDSYNEFEIVDYKRAIEEGDIIIFLVAHREFKTLKIRNKRVLNFCGK